MPGQQYRWKAEAGLGLGNSVFVSANRLARMPGPCSCPHYQARWGMLKWYFPVPPTPEIVPAFSCPLGRDSRVNRFPSPIV